MSTMFILLDSLSPISAFDRSYSHVFKEEIRSGIFRCSLNAAHVNKHVDVVASLGSKWQCKQGYPHSAMSW